MLIKLIKYDLSYSKKTIFNFLGVMLIAGIIINYLPSLDHRNIGRLIMTSLMITISIISFIIPVQNYTKNLFTDQGYLFFTLPVSRTKVLLSKIITTMIWFNFINIMVYIIMFITFHEFRSDIMMIFNEIPFKITDVLISYTIHMNIFVLYIATIIFLSSTIANITYKHKRLGSFWGIMLTGIYTYSITRIMFDLIHPLLPDLRYNMATVNDAQLFYSFNFEFTVILELLFISIMTFSIINYLLNKRIDLQ